MTYQDDPNRRMNRGYDRSYMGWIIGAALVFALIIGVFAYNRSSTSNTASNTSTPASSTSTTGSGAGTTGSGSTRNTGAR